MSEHSCMDIGQDDEGWCYIKCECGERFGGLPDICTAVDQLLDHVTNSMGSRVVTVPARVTDETIAAIEACPEWRTHGNPFRYCAHCPWTEEIEERVKAQRASA